MFSCNSRQGFYPQSIPKPHENKLLCIIGRKAAEGTFDISQCFNVFNHSADTN